MRNVVVTGGSRGLGLGIARRLAAAGYRAIAIARKETNQLTLAMEEAERARAGSFRFVPFDLAEIGGVPQLVKTLRSELGAVYGLVNNAAVGTDGALALMPTSQIEQLVRLNTLSPIVLTKYVVRAMMADGGGRIVNVASIVGFTGFSGLSVYAATKASMLGFTRSLAREVGKLGVNVNAIAPGFVDTEMTHGLGEEHRQQIVRRSALRRLPEVEDIAHAVEFLLGRPEYLAAWLGITRVGGVVALLNANLTGPSLAHGIGLVAPRHVIAAAELVAPVTTALGSGRDTPTVWVHGDGHEELPRLDRELERYSAVAPELIGRRPTLDDWALYIYTSGTTGLPKAARVSH